MEALRSDEVMLSLCVTTMRKVFSWSSSRHLRYGGAGFRPFSDYALDRHLFLVFVADSGDQLGHTKNRLMKSSFRSSSSLSEY